MTLNIRKDIDGSCDGCIMFKNNGWCHFIKTGREKNCPCRICLVKVMCDKSCEEYNAYIESKGLTKGY